MCLYFASTEETPRSLSTKRSAPAPAPPSPAATSYVLLGGEEEMSCLVKEIPIPDRLLVANLMCVLCEHTVVLLEVSETTIYFQVALANLFLPS
jgi:hypothetical protein